MSNDQPAKRMFQLGARGRPAIAATSTVTVQLFALDGSKRGWMSDMDDRLRFLAGSDRKSALFREFDWTSTPSGPAQGWPDALKVQVALMLNSAQPMFIVWGKGMTWLYNHHMWLILGLKHPGALGAPAGDVWAEAWTDLEPMIRRVYAGQAVQMDDITLMLDRRGHAEEAHFTFSYNPAFGADGRVAGLFGVCTETTAQIVAQRRLARSEERWKMALSAGNSIGTWDWDVANDVVTADAQFAELHGVDPLRAGHGAPIAEFFAGVQRDDLLRLRMEVDEAIKSGKPFASEYRLIGPDESVKWVAAQGQAQLDEAGNAMRFLGVSFDVTPRKQAEQVQALLQGELQHRNKNLMAMIQAISAQTLRGDDIRDRREAFTDRLLALGKAQDVLTASSWAGASVRTVLEELTTHQGGRQFTFNGPEVSLDARRALSLALAAHELTTNSVKYGALSVSTGHVFVNWATNERDEAGGGLFTLQWVERNGPTVAPPAKEGFGSRLVTRVLASDFEGHVGLDYDPGGVRAAFTAPLESVVPG